MTANRNKNNRCAFPECISQIAPLLRCSQCKEVFYCSPEHQKSHWKIHKPVCTAPSSINNTTQRSSSGGSSSISDGGGDGVISSEESIPTGDSSSIQSETRISRCMFCGESLVLSCEEDAVSHMRVCPALQEQLSSDDQFTIPTMLRDKMQPKQGGKYFSMEEDQLIAFFDSQGYLVYDHILPLEIIHDNFISGMQTFKDVILTIESKSLHFGIGVKNGFKEIVQRQLNRFEMQYDLDAESVNRILEHNNLRNIVAGVLKSPNFDVISKSFVISKPNCESQTWHSDGPHLDVEKHLPCHCLNIFIPLIDVTPSHGPTELRPSSHIYTRDLAKLYLLAHVKKEVKPNVAPALSRGSVLMFDYRILHRGQANQSNETRPILVITCAKPGFKDVLNFPSRSIHDETSSGEKLSSDCWS